MGVRHHPKARGICKVRPPAAHLDAEFVEHRVQGPGDVQSVGPLVEAEPVDDAGLGSPAKLWGGFEEHRRQPAPGEIRRRHQPGDAAADHHDTSVHRQSSNSDKLYPFKSDAICPQ